MSAAEPRPALFLDRDGVVNVDVHHLHRPEDVALLPGVADAIGRANAAGVPVLVVTNQAAIAKGIIDEPGLAAVTARIAELLAPARIDATYHCPHHPDAVIPALRVACECRKPRPGLLRRAAAELRIDLSRSILVGDKRSDLEAARAAGCGSVLVRTGYGADVERALAHEKRSDLHDAVFDSLAAAAPWLIARLQR